MSNLPKSLDPNRLLSNEAPGDITLGEMKVATENSAEFLTLRRLSSRPELVRVRFLLNDGKEAPDTMTLREMRRLAKEKKIHVVIDDGEGGVPA